MRPPISPRRTFSQNDVRLHRRGLRGSSGPGVLPHDGGVTVRVYQRRNQPVTNRELDEAYLANRICDIHTMSRQSYGAPRVHAELRLGQNVTCNRKRVERIMRECSIQGIHRRRKGGTTRRSEDHESSDDLVNRNFDPDGPNQLWVMDITEHPTKTGKVYLAAVLDAFSRRVVGWSIADHIRAELVADALQMATWRRRPEPGQTVAHSDHGSQCTSWLFGKRLRDSGLLGSMGSIGDCFDNSVAESFFGTLQLELLDEQRWELVTSSPTRSLNGSKPGTTRNADTATPTCSAQSTTKPQPRHNQHNQPVLHNGGSSISPTVGIFFTKSLAL